MNTETMARGLRITKTAAGIAVFLLAALFFPAGCSDREESPASIQPSQQGERIHLRVDVISVRKGDIHLPLDTTGTVTPYRESRVSAKVSGRLVRVSVDEGDLVSAGQILAELEKEDFELSRDSAAAQVAMGKASLNEAMLNLEYAEREKNRMERLLEREAVSRQKYDEMVTAQAMSLARVEALNAQIQGAEAGLELAERQLRDAVITSPIPGYVTSTMANEGEVIAPGNPLFWIMDVDPVRAVVKISETDLWRIAPGMPAEVAFDALAHRTFDGVISEIHASIDPVSRNATVKIDVSNEDHLIRPGMFARVTIQTEAIADVIIVPERALIKDREGRAAVFVLEEDRARIRTVTTGMRATGLVEVRQGLNQEETVLVSGIFGLSDDTEVITRPVQY